VSFYEEDVWPRYESVIVEKHSALMEVAHEDGVLMGGNHSTMCKFAKGEEDDERFDLVWKRVKRAARGPKK
jgi:coenzyme F420-reducing hydrogenase delta subunit